MEGLLLTGLHRPVYYQSDMFLVNAGFKKSKLLFSVNVQSRTKKYYKVTDEDGGLVKEMMVISSGQQRLLMYSKAEQSTNASNSLPPVVESPPFILNTACRIHHNYIYLDFSKKRGLDF